MDDSCEPILVEQIYTENNYLKNFFILLLHSYFLIPIFAVPF
jgi:hypothetical protein